MCIYTVDNPPGGVPLARKDLFHNFINHLPGAEELLVTLDQALVVQ